MTLADIVRRIAADAADEATLLVAEAKAHGDELLGAARAEAERSRAAVLEAARREADAEAETVRASARLAARDSALAAKRGLIDSVLEGAREAIASMPVTDYAAFLAARIAGAARGGERVLIAPADAPRLSVRLPEAVAALGVPPLEWPGDPAPVEHGVVLVGDRVSFDLSIDAIVSERSDEFAMLAAERLFGGTEV